MSRVQARKGDGQGWPEAKYSVKKRLRMRIQLIWDSRKTQNIYYNGKRYTLLKFIIQIL